MNEDETRALVLERLSSFLERPITVKDLDQGYDSLGADSMDMVAISFEVEKAYGIPVLPEVFLQYDTLNQALSTLFELKKVSLNNG